LTDHAAVRGEYQLGRNTVAPIVLIAVSLNNSAVRQNLPFKFCWLDIPFQNASAALFMSLDARPLLERLEWADASPARRIQTCSAWQNSIRKTAQAITINYDTMSSCKLDSNAKMNVPVSIQHGLFWMYGSTETAVGELGTLLFPSEQKPVQKDQFTDNVDDLLSYLITYYHFRTSKKKWDDWQRIAVGALNKLRASRDGERSRCSEVIRSKQGRAVEGDEATEGDSVDH